MVRTGIGGPQVSRHREERTRYALRQTIACEKRILRQPPRPASGRGIRRPRRRTHRRHAAERHQPGATNPAWRRRRLAQTGSDLCRALRRLDRQRRANQAKVVERARLTLRLDSPHVFIPISVISYNHSCQHPPASVDTEPSHTSRTRSSRPTSGGAPFYRRDTRRRTGMRR